MFFELHVLLYAPFVCFGVDSLMRKIAYTVTFYIIHYFFVKIKKLRKNFTIGTPFGPVDFFYNMLYNYLRI